MFLFWDTETAGLPRDNLPDDHPSQPHLVELGAILTDDNGHERGAVDLIVRPDGWTIPAQAADVHGITTDIALKFGVPLALVCASFANLRAIARQTICHNGAFDEKIMRYAFKRLGREPSHPGPDLQNRLDTMSLTAPVLKMPPTNRMRAAGFNKFKPPKLIEAYKYFFNEELVGAHSAINDARACARIYFHMKREGLL